MGLNGHPFDFALQQKGGYGIGAYINTQNFSAHSKFLNKKRPSADRTAGRNPSTEISCNSIYILFYLPIQDSAFPALGFFVFFPLYNRRDPYFHLPQAGFGIDAENICFERSPDRG
jgi:hypothetical protein